MGDGWGKLGGGGIARRGGLADFGGAQRDGGDAVLHSLHVWDAEYGSCIRLDSQPLLEAAIPKDYRFNGRIVKPNQI